MTPLVPITDVVATVAHWAGVPLADVLVFGKHRKNPRIVAARNVAAFVLHDLLGHSYPDIARECHTRHSTIIGQRKRQASKLREVADQLDRESAGMEKPA